MKPSVNRSRIRRLALTACLTAPFSAFAQPLYHWSFNAGDGVPAVTAGGGTLTPNGTALFTGAGASGSVGDSALSLSNAYTGGVGAGNSASAGGANVLTGVGTLSAFTVTMWVKITAGDLSNFPRLLQLGATATPDSNSNPGINLLLNSGALEIGVNSRTSQVPAAFAADQWRFVVFTYDGTATNPYFSPANNGLYAVNNNAVVLMGSLTNSVTVTGSRGLNTGGPSFNVSPGVVPLDTTATLYLGNRADGGRGYTGLLDDVRIYNTQLTLAELEAIRLETAPPPPEGGTPYFWKGDAGAVWNGANWTSDQDGTTVAALPVDGTAAATFLATGALNFNNTVLGADQNVKSLVFNSQASGVEIGGTHSLTIGSGGISLDTDAGTVSINTTGQVVLGGDQTWTNRAASAFTVSSVLSGAFTLTIAGPGETILSGANTHAGTTIESGTLRIQNALALGPLGTSLNVAGGTLDLNGLSIEVAHLQGSTLGTVTNLVEGITSTLVANTPDLATDTFSGHLNNASASQVVAFTKSGPGTLILASTSNFTGNLLVSGGTLVANNAIFGVPNATNLGNAQFPGRAVTIAGGATLRFGNTNVLGNGSGDLSSLPAFTVESGGTFTTTRYNVIGGITLNGGTLDNAAGEAGAAFQAFQFKGVVTAGGATNSLISTSTSKANHLDANTSFEVGPGSTLTISTPLADQSGDFTSLPGGFTKNGPGTLVLNAANTYTGATTLAAGRLVLSSATSLSDTATFAVSDPLAATLELNYTGTETVADFTINGVSPGPGTYGRIGSGATHTYAWITGDGLISISATTTPLQAWRQTYFGTTEGTGSAANDADPDSDGVANLLEYALGGDPVVGESDLLPVQVVDAGHLELSFSRIADTTLTYSVLASDDLASWSSIWTSTGAENVEGVVTVTDPELLSAHPRRFLRLEVAAP